MTNTKNLSEFQKIIPELHFDLISRIVPGFILLFLMAQWVVGDTTPADACKVLFNPSLQWTWRSVLLAIPLSYVLGLFCSAISRPVSWIVEQLIIWRTISKEDREWTLKRVQPLLKTGKVDPNSRQFMRLFDPIHDYLKGRKESQSTLLSKLVAEVGLFYTLCIGLVLLALAGLLDVAPNSKCWYLYAIAALLAGIAGAIRKMRTWKRHISLLRSDRAMEIEMGQGEASPEGSGATRQKGV